MSRRYRYPVCGHYQTGYLRGADRAEAEWLERDGNIVLLRGPRNANDPGGVRLMYRPRNSQRDWIVWGVVTLHESPEEESE